MHNIVVLPVHTFHLAFGLEWQPLISGRASRSARRIARQRKASHLVLDGQSPASFGYGTLRRSGLQGRVLYSAAQNMARLYSTGTVACILQLDTGGYWLVAVHEGAVMSRTDVICRSIEQARQILEALRRSHPRLTVLKAGHDAPGLDTIARASDAGTSLRDTGRRRRQWLLRLGLLNSAAAALVSMFGAWHPRVAPTNQSGMPAAEAEARWLRAIQDAERDMTLHGVAATLAAVRQLHDVPARISGWELARVACQAHGALWQCNAQYDRRHPQANNKGLLTSVAPEWRLSFPTIERASATWEFHTPTLAAPASRLKTAAYNRRYLQSAWQGIRPAFNRIEVGPTNAIDIQTPLDDDGRPLPQPSGMPRYSRSAVQFEGPLRSVSLLLPHTHSIGWRSLSLAMGAPTQPSLESSRLRVTLHGDLYELLDTEEA